MNQTGTDDRKEGSRFALEMHNQILTEHNKINLYKAKFKELLANGNKKIVNTLIKSDVKQLFNKKID